MRRRLLPLLAAGLLALPLLGAASSTSAGRATLPAVRAAVSPAQAGTVVVPAPSTARRAAAGSYAFLHLDGADPVRWNPCADVPWTFNPAGAPAGGLAAVQSAFAQIGARTGLRFAYVGTSTAVPSGAYLQQSWKHFRPLLVGWTSAGSSDLLAGRTASTVGMTRVLWTGSYDSTGANRTQIASGAVALNRASAAPVRGPASWSVYALHELGHAVGLGHVADRSQVMNPVISNAVTAFGPGDLAGLARLGRGAGCLPDVR